MQLDTNQDFGTLYPGSEHLKKDLLSLQATIVGREKCYEWARNLRFIGLKQTTRIVRNDNAGSSTAGHSSCVCRNIRKCWPGPKKLVTITPAGKYPDCSHYVAVSWCWSTSTDTVAPERPWQVVTEASLRKCTIPDVVLSRAASFANEHDVPFIRINKECILQNEPADQETGIQSMDIVYQRSAWPLGLLQVHFDLQEQLDIFLLLYEAGNFTQDQIPLLRDVIRSIVEDPWFTRAWILQESVSGGFEMTLLMRHKPSLSKSTYFGVIPGELEISIPTLTLMITYTEAVVSDLNHPVDAGMRDEIIKLVKRFLTYLPGHQVYDADPQEIFSDPDYRQTCNAAQALMYLHRRVNSRVADRIAILGNLCNYNLRLDTNIIESSRFGFSICVFALAVFNGDISLTQANNEALYSFGTIAYALGPPQRLSLNTSLSWCEDNEYVVRAKPLKLLDGGFVIHGWLWKVDEVLQNVHNLPKSSRAYTTRLDLKMIQYEIVKALVREGSVELASMMFDCNRLYRMFVSPNARKIFSWELGKEARPELTLHDVFDTKNGEMTYRIPGHLESEEILPSLCKAGWNLLFSKPSDVVDMKKTSFWMERTLLDTGTLPLARLDRDSQPASQKASSKKRKRTLLLSSPEALNVATATFDIPCSRNGKFSSQKITRKSKEVYIFQPATILDEARSEAITWLRVKTGWLVELQKTRDAATGCRIVHGTGKTCAGYWAIPAGAQPEKIMFA